MNINNQFWALLQKLKDTSIDIDFFDTLKSFFESEYKKLKFEAIKLKPIPPFYLPLSEFHDVESTINIFSKSNRIEKKEEFIITDEFYVFPLSSNEFNVAYLLVFNKNLVDCYSEINQLCRLIRKIYEIACKNYYSGFGENGLQGGNLISQMSHDVNSLISLLKSDQPEMSDLVSEKLHYTLNMTKDILQYVREIQLLKSDVRAAELLESIIQNTDLPEQVKIEEIFNITSETISVDVELINRAIIEVIKNSVQALNGKGKITIHALINEHKNILNKNQFLTIIIKDNGQGINPDFLEFVKNPFFTTLKSEYHSGLGLSLAEKIIQAHQGFLDVETVETKNTTVTINLPLQRNEYE